MTWHSLRRYRLWLLPFTKLLASLIVLPSILTWLNLRSILQSNNVCFVRLTPTSLSPYQPLSPEVATIPGIYKLPDFSKDALKFWSNTIPIHTSTTNRINLNHESEKRLGGWSWMTNGIIGGYPSLLSLEEDLRSTVNFGNNAFLAFDTKKLEWCFRTSGEEFCTIGSSQNLFPPSGFSEISQLDTQGVSKKQGGVYISCPTGGASYLPKAVRNFWKKQMQKIHDNPNLEFLQIPTTSFLILVNLLLAFIYYNNRTDPSLVCKDYHKVVHEHELWRSFSGATAHFEPLHIGFNMMSLYALGIELEPRFGSLPFLFYNICLIPLTTIVMMGMIWMQIRYTADERLRHTKSVGYSGVLFAWAVITSLERRSTCPVPFMSKLCFKTYQFNMSDMLKISNSSRWIIKFNFAPLVQLLVAQVIMPRVSFLGHLSGIVCGFVLHWNLLPREIFYMPQVLIPALLMFHLWHIRKIISFKCKSFGYIPIEHDDEIEMEGTSANIILNSKKPDQKRATIKQLRWIQRSMILITTMSMFTFSLLGSAFLCQLLSTSFFFSSIHWQFLKCGRDPSNNVAVRALWKATIISLVLVTFSDAIQIPYWISMSTYIGAKATSYCAITFSIFLLLRFASNLAALILACSIATEIGPDGGAFEHVFGWIVKTCTSIATGVSQHRTSNAAGFSAFQGQGFTLGEA